MTELCHKNDFMKSVRSHELRTYLEILQCLVSDYLRKLADLLNIISGIWAVVYIKMLCLLRFSIAYIKIEMCCLFFH